jgi:hypothetical protein
MWSHVGVAIRILRVGSKWKVTKGDLGDVYLMEIIGSDEKFRLKLLTDAYKNHNIIGYKSLKDIYRTNTMLKKSRRFIKKYENSVFTTSIKTYILVLTGIRTNNGIRSKNGVPEFFCSELVHYYYRYVLNLDSKQIFGRNVYPELTTPHDFDSTPDSEIFEDGIYILYRDNVSIIITIILPLIIGLVLASMIWFSLPGNNIKDMYSIRRIKTIWTS